MGGVVKLAVDDNNGSGGRSAWMTCSGDDGGGRGGHFGHLVRGETMT